MTAASHPEQVEQTAAIGAWRRSAHLAVSLQEVREVESLQEVLHRLPAPSRRKDLL